MMFHGTLWPMFDRPIALALILTAGTFVVARAAYTVIKKNS